SRQAFPLRNGINQPIELFEALLLSDKLGDVAHVVFQGIKGFQRHYRGLCVRDRGGQRQTRDGQERGLRPASEHEKAPCVWAVVILFLSVIFTVVLILPRTSGASVRPRGNNLEPCTSGRPQRATTRNGALWNKAGISAVFGLLPPTARQIENGITYLTNQHLSAILRYRKETIMPAKNPPTGTDKDLNLATLSELFTREDAARKFLESKLWPAGPVCPHCGCCEYY